MKITRTSRLNALAPGMILALLLVSAIASIGQQPGGAFPSLVPSASAQGTKAVQRPRTVLEPKVIAAKDVARAGTAKTVVATSKSGPAGNVAGTFMEFPLDKGAEPQLMATAPDGSIFFTQGSSNKIVQIASPAAADSGKMTFREYAIPTAGSQPQGIVVAPDGVVWFAEQHAHQIGRLDPKSNLITEFPTPTLNSGPVGITVGPDGNIWFTEAYSNKIGVLDPNTPEKMEDFRIPTPASAPLWITSGPDGGLWYVSVRGSKLGRIDAGTKEIVEYSTTTPKAGPTSVVLGPDNALWITLLMVDKIARFDVGKKEFTEEIAIDSKKNGARSGPGILVVGTDGNLWFTEMFGNQIGRLNPETRQVHEFSAPTSSETPILSAEAAHTWDAAITDARVQLRAGESMGSSSAPGGITFSSDGTVWFTAMLSSKVARLKVK